MAFLLSLNYLLSVLAAYDFNFPKRVPKTAFVRLLDCDFIPRHGCAVLIGPTGIGKTHLLTALGYTACERGYSVSSSIELPWRAASSSTSR
jgi:DNA replication protein DnaC